MTPNTLGRTGVIKSFIKHTTPLKIDPKVSCTPHKISNRNIVQWASSITFRLLKMCLFTRHRDTNDWHECVYGGWSVLAVKFTGQIQKCLKRALEKRYVTEYKNSLSSSWKFAQGANPGGLHLLDVAYQFCPPAKTRITEREREREKWMLELLKVSCSVMWWSSYLHVFFSPLPSWALVQW